MMKLRRNVRETSNTEILKLCYKIKKTFNVSKFKALNQPSRLSGKILHTLDVNENV